MVDDDSRSVNTRNEFCLPFVSLHRHFYVSIQFIITAEYPYNDYRKSASSAKKNHDNKSGNKL
jgi:hypothetical protein